MAGGFKFDWVVVRGRKVGGVSPGITPKGVELAGASGNGVKPKASEITVSSARMTSSEAKEVLTESDAIAAAPRLPVVLIRSFDAAPSAKPTISWNVTASGADVSPFDGSGVTVAVLDTGIDAGHPAFAGVQIIQQNFTSTVPEDTDGHGTHCAGTIFGRDVDGVRIGIARGVRKALIGKVIGHGGGSTESIVNAVQWAQALGADVISMSLGMDFVGYQETLVADGIPRPQATALTLEGFRLNILMFAALARAIGGQAGLVDGSVVVAAAGNASNAPDYTIGVEPPANSEGFVSVAALDNLATGAARLASFSNVGARLAAGGVDIWSAKPGGGLAAMSGTSMATPTVAGLACLWAQKLGGPSSQEVVQALRNAAVGLEPGIPKRDVEWGAARAP